MEIDRQVRPTRNLDEYQIRRQVLTSGVLIKRIKNKSIYKLLPISSVNMDD